MKGMKRIVTDLTLTLVCAVLIGAPGIAAAEIRFAVLPRLTATELYEMYTPLAKHLEKETGEKVSLVIPKDFDDFIAQVKSGSVDLGFANSLIYVQLKKDVDLEPLALAAEKKAGTKFRGIIIARKDSGIEKLQDLKGKKLVFVDKNSAAGYIFQMLMLNKAGLDVDKDFTTLPFAKKHDNVALAVYNQTADAGGIREDDFDKMKERMDITQLKIVAYSEYFPNWPMFATPKMNKAAAAKVQKALLGLRLSDPEAEQVLSAAKLAGFMPSHDKDYDQLRQAAKLVGAY